MKSDTVFLVTNRSASRVFYSVPELGIKSRDFQPGETKRITYGELYGLSGLPGGNAIIRDYLLIQNEEARENLVGAVEPEYNMTAAEVRNLILRGSRDEWLDALDFAPEGVIDLIKVLSTTIPLTDTVKMEDFKKKKNVDLAKLIATVQEAKAAEESMEEAQAEKPERRTAPKTVEPATAARRTTGEKYKVKEEASTETEQEACDGYTICHYL